MIAFFWGGYSGKNFNHLFLQKSHLTCRISQLCRLNIDNKYCTICTFFSILYWKVFFLLLTLLTFLSKLDIIFFYSIVYSLSISLMFYINDNIYLLMCECVYFLLFTIFPLKYAEKIVIFYFNWINVDEFGQICPFKF